MLEWRCHLGAGGAWPQDNEGQQEGCRPGKQVQVVFIEDLAVLSVPGL